MSELQCGRRTGNEVTGSVDMGGHVAGRRDVLRHAASSPLAVLLLHVHGRLDVLAVKGLVILLGSGILATLTEHMLHGHGASVGLGLHGRLQLERVAGQRGRKKVAVRHVGLAGPHMRRHLGGLLRLLGGRQVDAGRRVAALRSGRALGSRHGLLTAHAVTQVTETGIAWMTLQKIKHHIIPPKSSHQYEASK